jgi:L-fuconolactonase
MIGTLGEFDQPQDSYQQRFLRMHPDRLASVCSIDHNQSNADETLRRFFEDGAVGVRLNSEVRSAGQDPYAIWRTAEELGMVVSCGGTGAASPAFVELIEEVPRLTMVLELFAGVGGSSSTDADRDAAWGLARYPNLFIKVGPISTIAERERPYTSLYPFKRPIPNYLESIYELWGPDRIMWGSNFPPVAAQEGYANALRYPREEYAAKPVEAQRQVFRETATRVFWPTMHSSEAGVSRVPTEA